MRAGGAILVVAGLAATLCSAGQVMRDRPIPLPDGQSRQADQDAAVQFFSPEQVTVSARHPAQIDLHFRVANGWHINSHAPLDKSLIPARLAVVEAPGLNVTAVDFPPGTDYALQLAPKDKLNVYTGEFVLHAHLTAQPGEHVLQASLRYQACDSNACMPPHSIPVEITILAR